MQLSISKFYLYLLSCTVSDLYGRLLVRFLLRSRCTAATVTYCKLTKIYRNADEHRDSLLIYRLCSILEISHVTLSSGDLRRLVIGCGRYGVADENGLMFTK